MSDEGDGPLERTQMIPGRLKVRPETLNLLIQVRALAWDPIVRVLLRRRRSETPSGAICGGPSPYYDPYPPVPPRCDDGHDREMRLRYRDRGERKPYARNHPTKWDYVCPARGCPTRVTMKQALLMQSDWWKQDVKAEVREGELYLSWSDALMEQWESSEDALL